MNKSDVKRRNIIGWLYQYTCTVLTLVKKPGILKFWILSQIGVLFLWFKFGDPCLKGRWVMVQTIWKGGKFGLLSWIWLSRSRSILQISWFQLERVMSYGADKLYSGLTHTWTHGQTQEANKTGLGWKCQDSALKLQGHLSTAANSCSEVSCSRIKVATIYHHLGDQGWVFYMVFINRLHMFYLWVHIGDTVYACLV